ncbi:photosystem I assembly protein Ycf3 [Stieleria maiorica]|uniref:Photosystem I assembly protein Ycf3 n=1 Tax=Stieleria maiorica TaxID=2795974 RepID=A0A5B9M779_9BACT|nr:tetratricopeptide repeat protein [Stieleria maiorica]QEF96579.1 photosystem I assembly protein Ycf3 [Stieleria maiorica]
MNRYTIPACLIALSLVIYLQATGFQFVAFDDAEYVSRNLNVQNGINASDVTWALTTTRMGNWHPLLWWSFQLDSQLYGNGPFGFHLTNVILHSLSVVVLFIALKTLGLRDVMAAAVVVLFCVHPLNVESVAWVAERKGTLSTLFWMLGMLAYGHYARRSSPLRMVAVFLCMTAGLMSKPSLLTFPFAMMLLDVWPLYRIRFRGGGENEPSDPMLSAENAGDAPKPISLTRSVLEKSPLFLLSLVFFFIALSAQESTGAVATLDAVPLRDRLLQIPCAYVIYLWRLVMPIGLTVGVLPPRDGIPVGIALLAAAVLTGISIYAWRQKVRVPVLFVGWFWFIGTMFPTSGIVPIGIQWMADRYTYVPNVGLFLLAAAACLQLVSRFSISFPKSLAAGMLITAGLVTLSVFQARHWRDSETLLNQVISVDPDNSWAHANLAGTLIDEGKYQEALLHAEAAVGAGTNSTQVRNPVAVYNVALCKAKLGRTREAIDGFARVIEIDPSFAAAFLNLGNLLRRSDASRAEACYREAIRLKSDYAEAHNNLGGVISSRSPREAREHFETSLRIWPDNPDAHTNLGNLYAREGNYQKAIECYKASLRLQGDHVVALQNLKVLTNLKD